MVSWKELILKEMVYYKETWDDVISCTLSQDELNEKFDDMSALEEGSPFTVWTKDRVYFPVTYDGNEDVKSVSRNPDGKPTQHIGG